ncbi:hypothetical protein NKH18_45700 [Streptomyces sp. M10(2022)]
MVDPDVFRSPGMLIDLGGGVTLAAGDKRQVTVRAGDGAGQAFSLSAPQSRTAPTTGTSHWPAGGPAGRYDRRARRPAPPLTAGASRRALRSRRPGAEVRGPFRRNPERPSSVVTSGSRHPACRCERSSGRTA